MDNQVNSDDLYSALSEKSLHLTPEQINDNHKDRLKDKSFNRSLIWSVFGFVALIDLFIFTIIFLDGIDNNFNLPSDGLLTYLVYFALISSILGILTFTYNITKQRNLN